MEMSILRTRPFLDTVAAIIFLMPLARLITDLVGTRWRITMQLALLFPAFMILFNKFNPPMLHMSDMKGSKRMHKHGHIPKLWLGVIELYMFFTRKNYVESNNTSLLPAHMPQVRYVGRTSIGLVVPDPRAYKFYLNGFRWTQIGVFEDEELVVLYNLAEYSLYHVKLVKAGTDETAGRVRICTSYGDDELKTCEILDNSYHEKVDAELALNTSASSTFQHTCSSLAHRLKSARSAVNNQSSTKGDDSQYSPFSGAAFEYLSLMDTESPKSPEGNNPAIVSSLVDSRSPVQLSLGDEVLPRPRKKFDIHSEALLTAQELLDLKRIQYRKLRKDSGKKLAHSRTEIDSLQYKLAAKLRADERTRKRIQALKERVAHHRVELAELTKLENETHTLEVEALENKALFIEKDFQSKKHGLDLSLRLWAEEQRTKESEIAKLEQRCAKLSDRLEKMRRDSASQVQLSSNEVDEYINQIRAERNNRKTRCVRLESDFVEAIRKLDSK